MSEDFKPARFTVDGSLFIGDDKFPYRFLDASIKVEARRGRCNLLTLTIVVGEVTCEGS